MSFSLKRAKDIQYIARNTATTAAPVYPYNIDISGYYEVNGIPINNSFYPSLNPSAVGPRALSVWTDSAQGNSNRSVTWSPELGLFALCSNSLDISGIYTSTDGVNWTARTTPAYGPWDITWARYVNDVSRGMFVAVSSLGTMSSFNGIDWSGNAVPSANDWVGITWSPEKQIFVSVARGATVNNNTVMVSSNGTTWTAYTPPINASSVCWAKELNKFFAIGSSQGVMSSSDGINWNITNNSISGTNIIWSSELGKLLANGGSGNSLCISTDGINWTNVTTPLTGAAFSALAWSPQLNMFLALTSGTTVGTVYSQDGLTWKLATATNFMRRATWSPELGIFVAVNSSGTRVQASSLAGRPPTSYNLFDSSYNNINEFGLWNFQSFGRGAPIVTDVSLTVLPGQNWIDCSSASDISLGLPTASLWSGRELMVKTRANAVGSTAANVVPLAGGAATRDILAGGGAKWATLVSDGSSNWVISQST